MELHKPKGFNRGGPAVNFQQIAMGNQSKQNDQGIMNVIREPVSGMDQDVNFQVAEPPDQTRTVVDEVVDERPKKTVDAIQKGVEKAKQDSLFTDAEKKGIFAAQLALALSQPGDPFANLAGGLGRGAMSLADLKATEAELEQRQTKFADSEAVIDKKTGTRAFATEKQKQTEFLEDGSPRFVPIESEGTTDKVRMDVVTQGSDGTYKVSSIKRSEFDPNIHQKFMGYVKAAKRDGSGDARISENELYEDQQKPEGEQKYKLIDKELRALNLRAKQADVDALAKAKEDVRKRLRKVRNVNKLGKRAYAYVEAGARGGISGSVTQFYQNLAANIQNFVKRDLSDSSPKQEAQFAADYKEVNQLLKGTYAKGATIPTDQGIVNIDALSQRFANLDAGLQSVVIELAYAKAKSREEGGRFSVSDIQAAMDSIGNNADPNIMKSKIAETVYGDLEGALSAWTFGDLPDEFQDLVEDRKFFLDRTALGATEPTTEGEENKGPQLPEKPLTNEELNELFNTPGSNI